MVINSFDFNHNQHGFIKGNHNTIFKMGQMKYFLVYVKIHFQINKTNQSNLNIVPLFNSTGNCKALSTK